MGDYQDMVQERLSTVSDLFKALQNAGLQYEILIPHESKDQYGKELAQHLAMTNMIAETFDFPELKGLMLNIQELNQNIDGYRIDKAIEAQRAESGMLEIPGREQKK